MPTLRSSSAAAATPVAEPVLSEVLERLMGASGSEIRSEFLAIRRHFADDVANIVGFFLGDAAAEGVVWDPLHRKSHRYLLMWLLDFAGLKHPLIVTLLNQQSQDGLARIEVVRYTKFNTHGGDPIHTYKYALGRRV